MTKRISSHLGRKKSWGDFTFICWRCVVHSEYRRSYLFQTASIGMKFPFLSSEAPRLTIKSHALRRMSSWCYSCWHSLMVVLVQKWPDSTNMQTHITTSHFFLPWIWTHLLPMWCYLHLINTNHILITNFFYKDAVII